MNIVEELIQWYKTKQVESTIDIVIALIVIMLSIILSSILSYGIIKIFTVKRKNYKVKKNAFYKPLKVFFTLTGIYIAFLILKLPISIMAIINKVFKISVILLVSNGICNIVKPNSILFEKLKKNDKYKQNNTLLLFASNVIRIIVYIITAFVILAEFGYNLNGIVVGLGLGSVVIALAAQDIVKSLLAGATILTDKPFTIGDYIAVKDFEGTVEAIKFRSTKLRQLNGSMLNVPNDLLATETITNWTKLEKRRYDLNLELMLNTKLEKVNELIKILKQELEKMESVIPNSVEVHFDAITSNGMNIFIYLNSSKTVYKDFLEFKQAVNFKIMEILEKQNISLAYNSQDIYIRK